MAKEVATTIRSHQNKFFYKQRAIKQVVRAHARALHEPSTIPTLDILIRKQTRHHHVFHIEHVLAGVALRSVVADVTRSLPLLDIEELTLRFGDIFQIPRDRIHSKVVLPCVIQYTGKKTRGG